MSDLQAIADRVQIEALRGEATDATMTPDYNRAASRFTPDGVVRVPHIGAEANGRGSSAPGPDPDHRRRQERSRARQPSRLVARPRRQLADRGGGQRGSAQPGALACWMGLAAVAAPPD